MQTLPPLPKGNGNEEKRDQRIIEFSNSAKNPRVKRPASEELSSKRQSDKSQSTRYSQLSTFGVTFQIYEENLNRIKDKLLRQVSRLARQDLDYSR